MQASVLAEAPLHFVHPLFRAAIYDELGRNERALHHRRAAGVLAESGASGAAIAQHLLVSMPSNDRWVLDQLQAAARQAAASGAYESAAVYLRRAVAEMPSSLSAELLLELGMAEVNAGQPDWDNHFRQAVALAEDDVNPRLM